MQSGMMPVLYHKVQMIELMRIIGLIVLGLAVIFTADKAFKSVSLVFEIIHYNENMQNLKAEKEQYGLVHLKNTNKDLVAWISIEDVEIDLPIVNASTTEDEEYYLSHDFWGYENPLGCPYQTKNASFRETENVSIAGHSTFNFGFDWAKGTQNIFGNLHYYLNYNSSYNYNIKIETLTEVINYKVFASILFNAEEYDEGSLIFNTTSLKSEWAYDNFCQTAKSLSTRDYNVETTYGKQLLTLITCEKTDLGKRVLICAVEQWQKAINSDGFFIHQIFKKQVANIPALTNLWKFCWLQWQ